MTTIYTEDGSTVARRYRDAPRWHWVATDGHTGRFVHADTSVGYFPLIEADRPADTDTQVHEFSLVRDGDVFRETWTARDKTDDEQAADRQSDAPDPLTVLTEQAVAASNIDPQPWKQPTGAHDAYLPGAIVLDGVGGDRHRNDLGVPNVWPLTERHAKWTNLDAVAPVGPQPWVQPTGGHDAYQTGDTVTFDGDVYESTIDNNTWSPVGYPAGWQMIES